MLRSLPLLSCLIAVLSAAPLAACREDAAAQRLRGYSVDLSATSVSGVSAGGFMAVQVHVAHSASVAGAGVFAAGPYYCAQGDAGTATHNCMRPGPATPPPSAAALKLQSEALARAGEIDVTENLARSRVWLFAGKRDATVTPEVVRALEAYYAQYLPASALAFVGDLDAGHAMITSDYGASCPSTQTPHINDCDFDGAGRLLQHVLGSLEPPSGAETGKLIAFDQREFAGGRAYDISLADAGYAYVPDACESASCRVHVVFHGCGQSVQAIGQVFVRHAGYNRWADSNRIIVLYPQTIARDGAGGRPASLVYNPHGCWDWWGYTGPGYHTKSGAQVRAVRAMLDRLAEPR